MSSLSKQVDGEASSLMTRPGCSFLDSKSMPSLLLRTSRCYHPRTNEVSPCPMIARGLGFSLSASLAAMLDGHHTERYAVVLAPHRLDWKFLGKRSQTLGHVGRGLRAGEGSKCSVDT